ncbi:MAG: chromate transporter [Eubacterium sp.]|jgi:chromate transporter
MKELFELLLVSIKVGALTFGGGYAMLPILEREVVEGKKWNTEEEILDYYALSQCLPGILMTNTMAFVGEKKRGKVGAAVAAVGAAIPSFIVISIIAVLLSTFADYPAVQHAFAGIRACVCVLIFNSILKMWKSSVVDKWCGVIFAAVVVGSAFTDISPVLFVVIAAAAGIAISLITAGKSGGKTQTKTGGMSE